MAKLWLIESTSINFTHASCFVSYQAARAQVCATLSLEGIRLCIRISELDNFFKDICPGTTLIGLVF